MGQINLFTGEVDTSVNDGKLSKTAMQKLERDARKAYREGDSVEYARLADLIGYDERELLGLGTLDFYKLGKQGVQPSELEQAVQEELFEPGPQDDLQRRVARFMARAGDPKLGLQPTNAGYGGDAKANELLALDPERYGPEGKNVGQMPFNEVAFIYRQVYLGFRKR